MNAYNKHPQETLDQYINRCFQLIFTQLANENLNVVLMGLGQFEVLYQFCRTFDINSKWFNTVVFKKAFKLLPIARHIFKTEMSDEYKKEFEEFKKMRKLGNC